KPTTAKKESTGSNIFASLTIVICIIIGVLIWKFVMGHPSNFGEDGQPLPGNFPGMIYKGGIVVPVLFGMLLMVVVFSIERFIVISKAAGSGSVEVFVRKIQTLLSAGNIDSAIAECDKQKGSV